MRRRNAFALTMGALALLACGDDGTDDAGNELTERVRVVLAEDPALVGDLDVVDITCPDITDFVAGDRATCLVHLDGEARRVEVDLEFAADGTFDVVAVQR